MPVDFFKDCKRQDCEEVLFGLCDDTQDGNHKPAYIDKNDSCKWIATVHNDNSLCVSFYAIDGCVSWNRDDGKESGKCDGMLCFNDYKNVLFVELKNRTIDSKAWRKDAKDQLMDTLTCFFKRYNKDDFNKIEAFICNKRHFKNERYMQFCNNFKKETSVPLHINREIVIIK